MEGAEWRSSAAFKHQGTKDNASCGLQSSFFTESPSCDSAELTQRKRKFQKLTELLFFHHFGSRLAKHPSLQTTKLFKPHTITEINQRALGTKSSLWLPSCMTSSPMQAGELEETDRLGGSWGQGVLFSSFGESFCSLLNRNHSVITQVLRSEETVLAKPPTAQNETWREEGWLSPS